MYKIIERKIWSHSCMIHFAIKLCAQLVQTIRPDDWLILIKHSMLNILWFTAIIQTNYEVFCENDEKTRRRMSREFVLFSIETECNEMIIVLVVLSGKLWFIPQQTKEISCELSKVKKSSSNKSWQKFCPQNQSRYSKYLMILCLQPQLRQHLVDFCWQY